MIYCIPGSFEFTSSFAPRAGERRTEPNLEAVEQLDMSLIPRALRQGCWGPKNSHGEIKKALPRNVDGVRRVSRALAFGRPRSSGCLAEFRLDSLHGI